MTSRLRWQFLSVTCAAVTTVSIACAKAGGDTEKIAATKLAPIPGFTTAKYHVDVCGNLVGKTSVSDSVYEAAWQQAVADAKTIHDSIQAARGMVNAGPNIRAPGIGARKAAKNAKRLPNPPLLTATWTAQGGRASGTSAAPGHQRAPEARKD